MDNTIWLGLVRIKLGANYQGFDPLRPQALELYARAQKLSLPIIFHTSASPVREAPLMYSHPTVTDKVALRFPQLIIGIAHIGHSWLCEAVVII